MMGTATSTTGFSAAATSTTGFSATSTTRFSAGVTSTTGFSAATVSSLLLITAMCMRRTYTWLKSFELLERNFIRNSSVVKKMYSNMYEVYFSIQLSIEIFYYNSENYVIALLFIISK
ncbi:hypothetical protein TNCT_84541 [Trichonephila clavata]|uniref:Uncharacterized protein n=1 Tax=Trichonephila clavata TaxID=2740835 RepID=A0A8X6FUZ6_TRICU|nr:hypothetical protein TNCT_84541 [Trichonephila clavata]